ncbi:MAG: hypothetical protein WKF33_03625 [Thermoleophilaceae bacterium]
MPMADAVTQSDKSSDDLKHVLDAARNALDREFQRAERFDAKARGQATLAGSWFAVTQAVAAVSLQPSMRSGWFIALACLVALQAVALIGLLLASARVWRLQERPDIGEEALEGMEQAAKERDPEFASKALGLYRYVLYYAQEANARRAEALEATNGKWWTAGSTWWWAVLCLGLVEVLTALLARAL